MGIIFRDRIVYPFNGGRGVGTDQLAGAFVESITAEGLATVRLANGNQEQIQIGGLGVALMTLLVAPADNAGAFASSLSYESASGDFLVAVEATVAEPRILLRAPNGRVVSKVYDQGVDVSGDFTRRPGTQDWLSNRDYDGGAILLLVRTAVAGG